MLSVPVQEDESPSLQVLGASSLALRMWDLDSDQGSEMETYFLWYQVSSDNPWLSLVGPCVQQAVAETQMRFVTCFVCEQQLRLYGLIFLTLILLTRFSQRGSLVSGGGQWTDHVPHCCSRLIGISRRWGWARHLPGGWPDGGPWSTGGKWTQ